MLVKHIFQLKYNHLIEQKWNYLWKLFLIGLLIHVCMTFITTILEMLDLINGTHHPTAKNIRDENNAISLGVIFILSVIVHPTVEELSFRLFVTENSKKFSYGLALALSFILVLFYGLYELIDLNYEISFILMLTILALPIGFLIYKTVKYFNLSIDLRVIVIASSLLFALIHLNISSHQSSVAQYTIILTPYFLKGFVYSYARITMGFSYCILLHCMNNGFFFLINVLVK
ncbi:type II CAAX prenyl endopeptidase Rce1 family protein [Ekhidna sp.]|uniref:CPBP family glutamic-type intramembrane protease n=1 Tax=Ekhidna sp. TaxID=2608089 RepID=UPI003B5AB4E1